MYVYTCIHVYVRTSAFICMYIVICVYICTLVYVRICTCCVCVFIDMYAYMYVRDSIYVVGRGGAAFRERHYCTMLYVHRADSFCESRASFAVATTKNRRTKGVFCPGPTRYTRGKRSVLISGTGGRTMFP